MKIKVWSKIEPLKISLSLCSYKQIKVFFVSDGRKYFLISQKLPQNKIVYMCAYIQAEKNIYSNETHHYMYVCLYDTVQTCDVCIYAYTLYKHNKYMGIF